MQLWYYSFSKYSQRKCSVDLSPVEQRPAWKGGLRHRHSMQKSLQIDLLKWLSDTKVNGEAALLRASLLFPFILFSTRRKKAALPWKKGVITVHARGLSSKKISAHFRCPFQSPLFHSSQTISPPWWFPSFFSPFFCALPLQWCASCQGQREVFVRRRLGIKKHHLAQKACCVFKSITVRLYSPEMMEEKDHGW